MKLEIEANIDCCDNCRKTVTKNLMSVTGVESVDLYPEISKMVVMAGDVDPGTILRAVQRVKKKARILTRGASSPEKTLSDEHGRDNEEDNSRKKKSKGSINPVKEDEASEKAIVVYKPSRRSNERKGVAAESKSYGANVSAYGFGVGIRYAWKKIYKK